MGRKVDQGARRRRCAARPSRVLGLTFKPNTDDMRDAPSLGSSGARGRGAEVRGYDPEGGAGASRSCRCRLLRRAYEAAAGADAVVLVTEWDALRALDLRARRPMRGKCSVDLRNVYDRGMSSRPNSSITASAAAEFATF